MRNVRFLTQERSPFRKSFVGRFEEQADFVYFRFFKETFQLDLMESKKLKKTLWWSVGVIVVAALVCGGIYGFRDRQEKKLLRDYATSLNIGCPRVIGTGLTLNRVVDMPNNTLVYNVISDLLNEDAIQKDSLVHVSQLRQEARDNVLESLKKDPELPRIRRLGITFVYDYKFLDGSPFMQFTITPEDYQ